MKRIVRISKDKYMFVLGISYQLTKYPWDEDNKWINIYINFLCFEFNLSYKRK